VPADHSRVPADHANRVAGMFGRIAGWYDFLNRLLSLGRDRVWRRRLVDLVVPGPTGRVLDLAAGTLDVTLEILRRHPRLGVVAADFALPMLVRGRAKLSPDIASRAGLVLADGRSLPLADASVDCVTCAFGIRNIKPRDPAWAEILRVLAPGGRLLVLEFGSGRSRVWKGLYNAYLGRVLPRIGRLFSGHENAYTYLAETIAAFPTADELAEEMLAAGFARVGYRRLTSGIVVIHEALKDR